jgi:6-phosphogluconate dehydrogenase
MSRAGSGPQVGIVGLGVMGSNLALNLLDHGLRVGAWDRSAAQARALAAQRPGPDLEVAEDLPALVARLGRPRRILALIPAGPPVDELIEALDPLLEPGDVLIDAGNSHFADTARRSERARGRPWSWVGMGVSGGAEGARHGPSLMPGGDVALWPPLRALLEPIAARGPSGTCVTWCGRGAAGHFVKMVHNGIEYGEMQLIAEAVLLLRRGLGLEAPAVGELLADWSHAELAGFLVEITAEILHTPDPERPGSLLVDAILDRAGQKGTGRWTVEAALGLGVAVPSITAAVEARVLSADVELRRRAEHLFDAEPRPALAEGSVEDVRQALHAARIATLSQGFALLRAGSEAFDYGTELPEIARIWKAGCIIRSRLLDDVQRALAGDEAQIALFPQLREALRERLAAWRRVVAAASRAGLAIPALSASLQWLDSLTTGRGSAYLIQAQRDYFGAHRYERSERPGHFVHTDWRRAR